jgi:predicted nucleotidyltransferase
MPVTIRPRDLEIVKAILNSTLKPEKPMHDSVFVFGSRASGTTKRAADLDLAIDLGRPMTPSEASTLAEEFEESDLPYRVDVVDLHDVSAEFKTIIENQKIPLP